MDLQKQIDDEIRQKPEAPKTHENMDRLIRVVWQLTQEDGCPWDRVQTHQSISKNMIEEAYEAVEAIETNDVSAMREELGDVLLQVLLHAQIAQKNAEFDIDDIAKVLNEKLIRRHPHVFGERSAEDEDEVLDIWQSVKSEERKNKDSENEVSSSILDSIPTTLPALVRAQKLSKRALRVGFGWESEEDIWKKVEEEKEEFLAEEKKSSKCEEEFGDLLFAMVNIGIEAGIDCEEALRCANRKFTARFKEMEKKAQANNAHLENLSKDDLNELWDSVKACE